MPFQPGQSGNPGGRSTKEKPFRDALRLELAAAVHDVPRLRLIARKLVEEAETGNVQAIREVADRLDGKVPQGIVGDKDHDAIQLERIERVIVYPTNPDGRGVQPAAEPSKV